jgi:hypothetical protein
MNTKSENRVITLIEYLEETLNCKQKLIANLTGLTESTVSANKDKKLEEVVSKKAGRRLLSLYLAVQRLANLGLSSITIKESINEFVYEDLDGNFDSVVSAIISEKYDIATVVNIASLGLQSYQKKLLERDSLYPFVKETLAHAGSF